MKYKAFSRSLLRRASALVLAAALALPTVYASAGEEILQFTTEIVPGLDYVNTITNHPEGGRTESFLLELSPDSQAYPVMIQGSNSIYSGASINKAIEHAQAKGYHVLGAINTDYFSSSTGVPMGIVIEDGIYKSSPEGQNALTIRDGAFGLLEAPEVTITLTNQSNGQQTSLTHLNKWRTGTGGLYLLNEYFSTVSTRTSTSGWMVRMVEAEDRQLTVSGQLRLEVTEVFRTSDAVEIGENNYILTADDLSNLGSVFESFRVGDVITLDTQTNATELGEADWASGTSDVMIRDGKLTDSSQWTHVTEGRAPRTAFGVKANGTAILYVADGRMSGYSSGLSQLDLAKELLEQGCVWAVNLDGGGSSAMSVWVPGQSGPAVVNRPSDGRLRSCATYLLLVTDDTGEGSPARLALKNTGLVVLAGSSVPLGDVAVLDSGLNLLDRTAEDLTIRSETGLGSVKDGVYTAGTSKGTDTLLLQSNLLGGIRGRAQIHIVDSLTELSLTDASSGQAVTALSMNPGDQVALSATGSYWSRPALSAANGVTWTTDGNVGSVDENGVFTAALTGSLSGTITAQAGSLSQTIPVTLKSIHLDVPEDHWAYVAVEYCYEKQLVSGISSSQFGPTANIRRGDFLLMLYRMAGTPAVSTGASFPDLSTEDYYYTAVSWAVEKGLASGMADGTFAPGAYVTREQAFTILNRFLPLLGVTCEEVPAYVLSQFSDRDSIADWAVPHAATLVAYQVVGGSDGKLNPKGNLSRAEMAALLYKLGHYDPNTQPVYPEVDPDVIAELTIQPQQLTIPAGQSAQLTAAIYPETATGKLTWSYSSSVAGVAYLAPDGTLTNLNTTGQDVSIAVSVSSGTIHDSCAVLCPAAQQVGTVVQGAAALNVRSGPGTEHAVLDRISEGMNVIILEQLDNGWLHVMYLSKSGASASGYVSASYITQ